MNLDVVSSDRNYADHLAPIWHALEPHERGVWWAGRTVRDVVDRLHVDADRVLPGRPPRHGPPVLVASATDMRQVAPRPVVMLNHGSGQTYGGDPAAGRAVNNPSYTGGTGRDSVVLNLCPGPADMQACLAAQPDVPAVAVGCPKLDRWHHHPRTVRKLPLVVLSFHWCNNMVDESRWAYPHYRHVIPALAQDPRWTIVGHGHPRAFRHLTKRAWEPAGIEPVEHFDDVLASNPSLYVIDNSSTMFEAAALDIPVLTLNAPWYRRGVHHGLRFWSAVPGLSCDHPQHLAEMIAEALTDPPAARQARAEAAHAVYGVLVDGNAARRAAAVLRDLLG